MQNAELLKSRDALEKALSTCTDLYDFAPVGYFTLDQQGIIRRLNLTGASLLSIERSRLIGLRLASSIAVDARAAFADFLGKVFASKDKEACELALTKEGNSPLFVRIEAVAAASGEECRIAVINISERRHAEDALTENGASLKRSTFP